jgi:hypothetical protein
MTPNDKFGILTNWKLASFLRHAETPDCKALDTGVLSRRTGRTWPTYPDAANMGRYCVACRGLG